MAPNPPAQDIFAEAGRILGRLAPQGAKEVVFRAMVYPDFNEGAYAWVTETGEETEGDPDDPYPVEAIDRLLELVEDLQGIPPFSLGGFTHCEMRLDPGGALTSNFRKIPEAQSWTGLYMRGVADLTQEEAAEYFIPAEEWRARVAAAERG